MVYLHADNCTGQNTVCYNTFPGVVWLDATQRLPSHSWLLATPSLLVFRSTKAAVQENEDWEPHRWEPHRHCTNRWRVRGVQCFTACLYWGWDVPIFDWTSPKLSGIKETSPFFFRFGKTRRGRRKGAFRFGRNNSRPSETALDTWPSNSSRHSSAQRTLFRTSVVPLRQDSSLQNHNHKTRDQRVGEELLWQLHLPSHPSHLQCAR